MTVDVWCDRNSTTRLHDAGEIVRAEVEEADPLIRPAARRAAAVFLQKTRSLHVDGAVPRFVGVHGLEAVAACPLLRSAAARRTACAAGRRDRRHDVAAGRSDRGPTALHDPSVDCFTVVYTLRDGLSAALHLAHGCADAAAVLLPGEPGEADDRFAVVTWPSVLEAYGLTVREIDVLALLLARFTNDEIAQRLVISRATVRAHVRALQRKLGTVDRRAVWRRFAADLTPR